MPATLSPRDNSLKALHSSSIIVLTSSMQGPRVSSNSTRANKRGSRRRTTSRWLDDCAPQFIKMIICDRLAPQAYFSHIRVPSLPYPSHPATQRRKTLLRSLQSSVISDVVGPLSRLSRLSRSEPFPPIEPFDRSHIPLHPLSVLARIISVFPSITSFCCCATGLILILSRRSVHNAFLVQYATNDQRSIIIQSLAT